MHLHKLHSDSFFVFTGRLTVRSGEDVITVGRGSLVTVPPHIPHTFLNPAAEPVIFLNIHTPGAGFDRYVLEINAALDARASDEELRAYRRALRHVHGAVQRVAISSRGPR